MANKKQTTILTLRIDGVTKDKLRDLAYRRRTTVSALVLALVIQEIALDEEEL